MKPSFARLFVPVAITLGVIVACGSSDKRTGFDGASSSGGTFDDGGGTLGEGGAEGGTGVAPLRDPATCEEAATMKTYVGCDYWPTVTANLVQAAFDFAVAVANVGDTPANVTVTGANGMNEKITVAPGNLGKVFLPWVPELKGPDSIGAISASVVAKKGAYHLVSDVPVVVYQFNPLEFRAAGGPPGKDWSKCVKISIFAPDCYSYSNDASLLLPSTAMTGTYRIMGSYGFSRHPDDGAGGLDKTQPLQPGAPPFFAVTATQDNTTIRVTLSTKGQVMAGGGIPATPAGGLLTFKLDSGDVAEIVGGNGRDYDFSGSLLSADKPVQVIAGVPCIDFPLDVTACDHVEETLFPAETLGKHYMVMTPTGPKENKVPHVVRFYGNADNTTLKYAPSQPAGCPGTLNAGQVVECPEVNIDFEVTGDKEFGVGTFMIGAERVDPDANGTIQPQGDPSQSFAVAIEQYRQKYVFLAPTDYKTSYVDIVAPPGTKLDLDGADVSAKLAAISGTAFHAARIKLSTINEGTHKLTADKPIGIQVMGYGDNTTYMYPGGLNLGQIAAVPPK